MKWFYEVVWTSLGGPSEYQVELGVHSAKLHINSIAVCNAFSNQTALFQINKDQFRSQRDNNIQVFKGIVHQF